MRWLLDSRPISGILVINELQMLWMGIQTVLSKTTDVPQSSVKCLRNIGLNCSNVTEGILVTVCRAKPRHRWVESMKNAQATTNKQPHFRPMTPGSVSLRGSILGNWMADLPSTTNAPLIVSCLMKHRTVILEAASNPSTCYTYPCIQGVISP